jgi:hypothetical protein
MANNRFGLRTRRDGVSNIIKGEIGIPYQYQFDPDALSYIQAVEFADTQTLELGVQNAINDFVIGCKTDGIWDAIKSSCILAGARTLTGALVPLKGTAPTSFNFVSGDYNRKTGLVGNGTNKYLNSNRNNNADPQNNNHNAVYINFLGINLILSQQNDITLSGTNAIGTGGFRNRNSAAIANTATTGLRGMSRSLSTEYIIRSNGSNSTAVQASQTPTNSNIIIFAAPTNASYGTHRLQFYSIGEALDLALLDSRVTALMNAYDAAI